ncbi:MAG: MarR family winged helix-turn-helix transcriptional regulator [Cyanobacteria bacterium J06635_1]
MNTFDEKCPHLSAWVGDGSLEIGNLGYRDSTSFIRVLDEGGLIWESEDCFGTLDEALSAAEAGLAEWCQVHILDLVVATEASLSFTAKQGQYLSYIYNYTQVQGRPPAEADIQSFFQVTPPTVHQMIVKLEQLNLPSRVAGPARSLRVLIPAEHLPVLVRP